MDNMVQAPLDSYKRKIDYLRLSITDRCNLRCTYCMPKEGVPKLSHADIMRYEEILHLVRIIVGMGIGKIRITGGEPLVRKDALVLSKHIAEIPGVQNLSITTNGVLLAQNVEKLLEAGVKRINVSLDTLRPERFAAITRTDCFQQVWEAIMTAHRAGLSPIKLNAVVMRGVNEDEIEDLGRLTCRYPFHMRFIEFMPFQAMEQADRFVPADEILARLSRLGALHPVTSPDSNGPAVHYRWGDSPGIIGIISPISHHFCPTCNRLRLTADGKLRTCLFSSTEIDLLSALRNGTRDEEIGRIIRTAIRIKPEKHFMESAVFRKCNHRPMAAIGG